MGGRLYSLEAGRFLAAMLVLVCHLTPFINAHAASPHGLIFGGAVISGPLSVQYFFVLSGFVMVHSHHRDFGQLRAIPKFLWRRACRIYPVYWLALCVPVYYLYSGTPPLVMLHLWLLEPHLMGPRFTQEYIQAAWSLRYEIAFYIMFALCMLPYAGKPILALWVSLSLWKWCGPLEHILHPAILMQFNLWISAAGADFVSAFEYYFFAGLIAGYFYLKFRPGLLFSLVLLGSGVVLILFMLPGEGWGRGFGTPMFVLAFALVTGTLILGLALVERHGILRLGRIAKWGGAMSYAIYILHEPIFLVVENVFPWRPAHLQELYMRFAGMIVLVIAVSAFVTFVLDMPLQRGLRRLTARVAGLKPEAKAAEHLLSRT